MVCVINFSALVVIQSPSLVILSPSLCHSERSEESRLIAQDKLREASHSFAQDALHEASLLFEYMRPFTPFRVTTIGKELLDALHLPLTFLRLCLNSGNRHGVHDVSDGTPPA
jgi:hypothetical protein